MQDEVPVWAREMITACRSMAASPSSPMAESHSVPEQVINALKPGPKAKARPARPARPGQAPKFAFKGCWHCGKDEPNHNRKTCAAFAKMLKDANPGVTDRKAMKLPAGYKGAYEVAREKSGLPARTRRVNMLEDEDDSDDDESDYGDAPGRLCALRSRPVDDLSDSVVDFLGQSEFPLLPRTPKAPSPKSFTSPNSFQALSDDIASPPKPVAARRDNRFGGNRKTILVRSERELETLLRRDPRLAAIPAPDKKLRRVLRSMPDELVCAADEVLCLVDSGSTVNAAWIAKHFPAYAALVQQTAASLQGDGATTACGKKLLNKGRVVIGATCQGSDFSVAFKDMETELPILSVRKMIKSENDVHFEDGGGSIRNRRTGRILNFFEHAGVYFIKLKLKDPADLHLIASDNQGFQRQGR